MQFMGQKSNLGSDLENLLSVASRKHDFLSCSNGDRFESLSERLLPHTKIQAPPSDFEVRSTEGMPGRDYTRIVRQCISRSRQGPYVR